jgi:hypothetical protein
MNINRINLTVLIAVLIFIVIQLEFIILLGLWMAPENLQLIPDSASYLSVMESISVGYSPNEIRTIGYPFILFLIQKIACFLPIHFYQLVFIIQFLMLMASVFFWTKIVATQLSHKYIFLFVFILSINPSFVLYSFLLSTEISFLFFISGAFYFIRKYFSYQSKINACTSILFFAIAVLIRPGFYYFSLLLCFSASVYFIFCKKMYWKACLILVVYGSVIFSNQYFFYQKFGLLKLSTIDEITQYRYLTNQIQSIEKDCSLHTNLARLDLASQNYGATILPHCSVKEMNRFYHRRNAEYFTKNYCTTIKAFGEILLSNFHTGNTYYHTKKSNFLQSEFFNITRIFNMIFLAALFCCNIIFIFQLLRRQISFLLFNTLLLLFGNYMFVTSCISFWQGDRFNVVWFGACLSLVFLQLFPKKIAIKLKRNLY